MTANLRNLMAHPGNFRDAILIDVDGEPRRLSACVDDWQRADFEALDGGWLRVTGRDPSAAGKQLFWSERPRGHSKTSDLAVSVTWALFASSRRLSGICAAADKDQARLLRDAIDQLLRLNPWLTHFLEVQRDRVVNDKTGSELVILASDVGSSWGLTPDFVVADEIVHWGSRELWDSLLSASAKRKHCVVAVITNAGHVETWQFQAQQDVRIDPQWHFSSLDGPHASWITTDRLEQQRRLMPAIKFERLWLNQWTRGVGDALSVDDIEASVTLTGPIDNGRGFMLCGGLDLSVSRDKSAFVAAGMDIGWTEYIEEPAPEVPYHLAARVDAGLMDWPEDDLRSVHHQGTGRTRLAHTMTWSPPSSRGGKINLTAIEKHVFDYHQRFGLRCVLYDPYQCEHLAQRLLRVGVPMVAQPFTGNALTEMAGQLLEAFSSRTIDLFPDDELIADLQRLRIEEKSYGYRLTADRTAAGHCDTATALALALLACRRHEPEYFGHRANLSSLSDDELSQLDIDDEKVVFWGGASSALGHPRGAGAGFGSFPAPAFEPLSEWSN